MALTDKLTAIADAIRGKTGGTEKMTLDEMATAVEEIDIGGDIDALIDGSITSLTINATKIADYAFYGRHGFGTLNAPNVEEIGKYALYGTTVKTFDFPFLTTIGNYAFCKNITLENVNFPLLEELSNYAFRDCSPGLTDVYFPNVTNIGTECFKYCYYLARADFPKAASISSDAFDYCNRLEALILRGESLCTAGNGSILSSSLISNGTGYIYVPSALIEDYKVATNWATYADQFRALEDYTVDGTTTGELDESKIGEV